MGNHSISIIVISYGLFISLYSSKTDEKLFLWAIHYFLKVYLFFPQNKIYGAEAAGIC